MNYSHPSTIYALFGLTILSIIMVFTLYSHQENMESLTPCNFESGTKSEYQKYIICSTQVLRPGQHTYSGFSGPWLEKRFFNYYLQNEHVFYSSAYIYLPIFWTEAAESWLTSSTNAFLSTLDERYLYFTIFHLDRGIGTTLPFKYVYALNVFKSMDWKFNIPRSIQVVGFHAGGCSVCDRFKQLIPIPLLKEELPACGPQRKITHNVIFQGRTQTHTARKELVNLYHEHLSFLPKGQSWIRQTCSSNFTLCPRGFGETSFRLYESIQLGSIPIYIWEGQPVLPFAEFLDWNSFAIVADTGQVAKGELVPILHKADVGAMTKKLEQVRTYFTYNFTIHYITSIITDLENTPYTKAHTRSGGGMYEKSQNKVAMAALGSLEA